MFNLRQEDRGKVLTMGSVFFLAGVSEMLNYTSFMAIFNSRAGTGYLPLMYMIEAFVLPVEGWLLSLMSQRLSKPRFMIGMYLLFIALLAANGAALLLLRYFGAGWFWFYIQLFLVSNFIVRQQTLLMWATAFDLCPTQQAKRVMPVFVLCAIVGGMAAGVLSGTLAPMTGPEWLYVLAAVMLLAGFPNFARSIRMYLLPLTFAGGGDGRQEASGETGSSMTYVLAILRSPFLLAVIGVMTFMPAVYFVMEYQYFTSAQAAFPDEAKLTSFYGWMVILLFGLAFLLQLFASRLIERLGSGNTILAISGVFFISFGAVALLIDSPYALAAASAGYCLTYLLLYYFAEPGYQFFFKMLPLDQRDGYRYTAQGIAASAGILLGSALSMLHSELGWPLTAQAVVATAASLVLLLLSWTTRFLYIKELVRYLKSSSKAIRNVLADFLESMGNERVRQTVLSYLRHPDESIQRVTLELFAERPDPAATEDLLAYAERASGSGRAQAIAVIHQDGWRRVPDGRRAALMANRDDAVRAVVYRRQFEAETRPEVRRAWIREALDDPSPAVRAEGLRAMEAGGELEERLREMLRAGGESAILACGIIRDRRLKNLLHDVMFCLLEPLPAVRIAAVRAIGRVGDGEAATSLLDLLIGSDAELRGAIEEALFELGTDGMAVLSRFLDSPNHDMWRTAVGVCGRLANGREMDELIVPSCIGKLAELSAIRGYVEQIRAAGGAWGELAARRGDEMARALLDSIWDVMIRFGDERSIPRLRQAVEDPDEETRDHGLEILSEGIGHPKLSAALFQYYRQRSGGDGDAGPADGGSPVNDPWMQAIAIKAGIVEGASVLMESWEYLSALDKMVFLRQVPLFSEISVEELGRVAGIAVEKNYEEGSYLVRQGEPGRALVLIVEGHVELSGMTDDGREGTIGVLGPMQTLGEAGLFDDRPSPVSAQVILGGARVLEIDGHEAARLVRLYPDIGVGLLRSIGGRLRTMEQLLLKLG
jgi:ATP/ADP translocase